MVSRYWEKLWRQYLWFPDFWSIAYKRNLSYSKTSNDTDIETWTSSKTYQEKYGNVYGAYIILANRCAIVIIPIYGKFGEIWKKGLGRMICKTYIFIKNSLWSYKNWKKELKNLYHSFDNIALSIRYWNKYASSVCMYICVPNFKFLG